MAAPVLSSISPSSGPPGTAITCTGTGFTAGTRVGAPVLVETVYVSATSVTAEVSASIFGPAGGEMVISVWAEDEAGAKSALVPFTVRFPLTRLQRWTDIDLVASEVPGFRRGGRIKDATIEVWMRSAAQAINAALRKRAISMDAAEWDHADEAAAALEHINRLGAAARLAAAIGGEFSQGEYGLAKILQREYERELKGLRDGEYDRLFSDAAATVETAASVEVGDVVDAAGEVERAFTRSKVF